MNTTGRRPWKLAVGSIFQEGNHFVSARTDLEMFRNGCLLEGDSLLDLAGTDSEVAGILNVCGDRGGDVAPLIAARSAPGGPLTDACYAYLKRSLLGRLRSAGPVDGVVLTMHGAMAAETEDDPEGDLAEAVRIAVGPDIPVVMTLDLHANVTPRMVRHANALVAFAHYPHDDAFTTGERAARLLLDALDGAARPTMAAAKVPMIVPAINSQTSGEGPMARLATRARALERRASILSVSILPVHPHLDVLGLGCGAVVVTDGDEQLAADAAKDLAKEFWALRLEFEPDLVSVEAAVRRGLAIEGGPVLLVDAADCVGGGAPGDSVALLRELIESGLTETAMVMVVDPKGASDCVRAGRGSELTLRLGYGIDPSWGEPLTVAGTVENLCDGRFRYSGGPYGGTWTSMGASAVLRVGSVRVLIMSRPTYDWADEQYRTAGLDAGKFKFVGVKNPMNYRFAYRGVAKAAYVVDTAGPTTAALGRLPYKKLQRPLYPFDREMAEQEPTVFARKMARG